MMRPDASEPRACVPPAQPTGRAPLGRVAAVVVSFESGPEILRLGRLLEDELDRLIIVDNGSAPDLVGRLREIAAADPARIELIENRDNRGLAAAQNQGIEAALRRDADWILLLDDDSLPHAGFVAACAEALRAAADPGRVALLAPSVRQPPEAGETRYWTMRGRWRVARRPLGATVEQDAIFAIASGSLLRAAALRSLGPMREDFFIDYVDVEFGLRLRQAGWRILIVPGAVLAHRLGNPARHAIGALAFKSTNHDAARRFTIFRNRARLWRAYLSARPGWVMADMTAALADLARILCFEQEKRAKLGSALCGLWRGVSAPPM